MPTVVNAPPSRKKFRREEPNETTEMWREHRKELQARRADRRSGNTREIEALRDEGFTVRRLNECQFRIDEQLDLFPTNRRYHFIPRNKRGSYKKARDVVQAFFPKGDT